MKTSSQKMVLGFVLIAYFVGPVHGQSFDLNPRQWVPLDLHNHWHYRCCEPGPIFTDWILTSDRDTLIDQQRWVRFTQIACTGPDCDIGHGEWRSMTDDAYVLMAPDTFDRIDTLWNTIPRSILSVSTAVDTTLRWRDGRPGSITVTIQPNAIGQEVDSTHLSIEVYDDGFRRDEYVHNSGLARTGILGGLELVGAIVNGKTVGDAEWINRQLVFDLDIQPDTLFYSAENEIRFVNTGQSDLTLQRLVLSTTNAHEWVFELDANNTSIFVNLNAIEYPEQQIDVTLSPSDSAYLRVNGFDPCIVCGGKRSVLTNRTDTLVVHSSSASSPDTVLLDSSVYLPVEESDAPASHGVVGNVYPNPTTSEFRLSLRVEVPAAVTLLLYDALGREIATLRADQHVAGESVISSRLPVVPSGLYFLRVSVRRDRGVRREYSLPVYMVR